MTKQLKSAIVDLFRDCDKQGISREGYYMYIPYEKVEEVRYWFNKEVRKHGQTQYVTHQQYPTQEPTAGAAEGGM